MPSINDLPPPPSRSRSIDDLPAPGVIEQEDFAPSGPSQSESALRQFASGRVFGFDDEIIGALGAAGRVAGVKNLGSWKPFDPDSHLEMADKPISANEIAEAYRSNRDAIKAQKSEDADVNPWTSFGANLAGAVTSPISKITAPQKMGPLTKVGQMGQEMKTSALQGSIFAAGNSDADLTKGEVGQFAQDVGAGAALGYVLPPVIAGSAKAIKAGAQAGSKVAGWAAKKASNVIFSTTDEMIEKYIPRAKEINAAKSVEEMKNIIDDHAGKLRDAVESGKLDEAQAKGALDATENRVKQELANKKLDTQEALREARESFKEARERVLEPLRAVKAPTDMAADATAMVSDLKNSITGDSAASYELLNNSNAKADIKPVIDRIDEKIAQLRGYDTKETDAIIKDLEEYKGRILKRGWSDSEGYVGVPAAESKRLIQGLDKKSSYGPVAGTFEKESAGAFKGARQALDQSLKDGVPEYRAAMEALAPKTELLSKASATFGTPEAAAGKLGALNTPRGAFARETLGKLEDSVGKTGLITRDADKFAAAQKTLKDPAALRRIEQSLPEYQTLRQKSADLAKRNPRWTREQVEAATAKQRKDLAVAMSKRIFAQEQLEPIKRLTEGKTQGILESAMKGGKSNIENTRLLGKIGQETGHDFVQMADDLRIKQAFEKGGQNGARNVAFGGVLGFIFGGGNPFIAGAGISAGATIDKYGPRMSKAIIDALLKIKDKPSVQAIRSLSLPPEVKAEMEREFKLYVLAKKSASSESLGRVAEVEESSPTKSTSAPAPGKRSQNFADGGKVKTLGETIGYPGSGPAPKPDTKREQKRESYAHGGPIPGVAATRGDSEKNDRVPAMLSPGEIVLPRSVTMAKNAPEAAARFVAAQLKKSKSAPAKGFDKFAEQGAQKLGLDPDTVERLMQSKEGKELLIKASDLNPGSKAMQRILDQIQGASQ